MASIKIKRGWQYNNLVRPYTVLLDGEWAGKIMNEDQIELPIAAGAHSLQLKVDWCRSNIVSFSIAADEAATFECGAVSIFTSLFYVVFRPSRYLWLRQLSGRGIH
jgi:hypothetical protein